MGVAEVRAVMLTTAFKNLARMTVRPFHERGVRQALRSGARTFFASRQERDEAFDARHGTDTGRSVTFDDLVAPDEDAQALWHYAPTLVAPFRRAMDALPIDKDKLVFVDLGSGKGRTLLLASEYPFRRIVGVELSPKLHRIAKTNVAKFRSDEQQCKSFALVCMDAAAYEPPPEPTLLYMFQPFPIPVLDAVLARIEASLRARPRPFCVVYMNPIFEQRVVANGMFRRSSSGQAMTHGEFDWTIYLHP
jgi:SAM-dependent methyltransferase